ncbi:MAG: hypothetical protein HYV16_00445 [Gammaproteobacteria bacterium]|nr:hypothetical protein [Gammaproteobacteria bacterium]
MAAKGRNPFLGMLSEVFKLVFLFGVLVTLVSCQVGIHGGVKPGLWIAGVGAIGWALVNPLYVLALLFLGDVSGDC